MDQNPNHNCTAEAGQFQLYFPYKFILLSSTQIRKASAEQVYLVLLQNGGLVAEIKMEKALEIISETCWEGDMEAAKIRRLELYDIAGLDTDILRKASSRESNKDSNRKPTTTDENASYSSLVESSGF